MLAYPAFFHSQENEKDGFWVEFPDVDGCFSMGDNLEHAHKMAQESLSLHLASLINRNEEVPTPSKLEGKEVHYIHPSRKVLFSLSLRKARNELGLTQAKMASKLGYTQQYLNELEVAGKANPTLDKVDEIERRLGRELVEA